MAEENGLNKILKKVYATELDLIENAPVMDIKRKNLLRTIRERYWKRQSFAIKVAMVAFGLAVISAAVYYYNFFTITSYDALRERANVEAYLQRRNDLIPNLVKAASNYLNYEKNIFGHIAEVRGAVAAKSLEQSLEKAGIQGSALSKFQAVAEAYPALKASEAYTTLMKELSDTESKIAESRINYNKIANYYNSRLLMFPGLIFNTLVFRFKALPVFESNKAPAPDVQTQQMNAPLQQNVPLQQNSVMPQQQKQE